MPTSKKGAAAPESVEATEAAARKADEENVDLTAVDGSGSEGQIVVEDVKEAAEEQQRAENTYVRVHVVSGDPRAGARDGKVYEDGAVRRDDGSPISEAYFNEVHALSTDEYGNVLFEKEAL